MWTTERQLGFYAPEDGRDIQLRMHRDLLALQGLGEELPSMMGARVIVEKGYAIDAACKGKLSRAHYDTDLIVATPHDGEPGQLYEAIGEVLQRWTGFPWVATQQKRSSWVKFHEAGKRQWDDGITGTESDKELAHQMDLHVIHAPRPFESDDYVTLGSSSGASYRKPILSTAIVDTFGNEFNLTVPTVSDMLATKLRLIRSFETFYGNTLRESDYYDFAALFSAPSFEADNFLGLLDAFYTSKGLSVQESRAVIARELQPVAHLIASAPLRALVEASSLR